MTAKTIYWTLVLACIAILCTLGCKSIDTTTTTTTTYPDGRTEVVQKHETDGSFTLGMSEAPGKTIIGDDFVDLTVSGLSL
jgi:hypothetical protein